MTGKQCYNYIVNANLDSFDDHYHDSYDSSIDSIDSPKMV